MHSHTLPRLLTAAEIADQLGIPLPRLYELCRRGLIPHVRIGRQVRFDPLRLSEWIESGGSPCDPEGS